MKRLVANKWFTLPRLGKEVFSDLMRAKLKCDTKFGFQITPSTDVSRVLSILSSALGEEVELASSCFICEEPLGDENAGATICQDCVKKEEAYSMYVMQFVKLMESL